MGGQACVFYGAAEFSRDLDLLILADAENLKLLQGALDELKAEPIAVPDFRAEHLRRGHAVHFRCRLEEVAGLRIDIMSSLRDAPAFEEMWARRTTIEVDGEVIDLLAVEDLIRAKKTQRDKDWPMIRGLAEETYFAHQNEQTEARVKFWLEELRTPELLLQVAARHPAQAQVLAARRPAIQAALRKDAAAIEEALATEEREERQRDRAYWAPLKRELEELRARRLR